MSRVRMLAAVFLAMAAFSAIAASSAQAGWLVLGSLLVGSAAISKGTIVDKEIVFVFGGGVLEIACKKLEINGGMISEPDELLAKSLEFSECVVVKPVNCTLEGAKIASLPVEGLVTLDGKLATKARVDPENAQNVFATFKINGANCTFTGKHVIIGGISVLDPQGQDERLWHLLNLFVEKEGELEEGSGPATISGSVLVKLESDMLWSFD